MKFILIWPFTGNIQYVDYDNKIPVWCKDKAEKLIDGKNCSLIPGLVGEIQQKLELFIEIVLNEIYS